MDVEDYWNWRIKWKREVEIEGENMGNEGGNKGKRQIKLGGVWRVAWKSNTVEAS